MYKKEELMIFVKDSISKTAVLKKLGKKLMVVILIL